MSVSACANVCVFVCECVKQCFRFWVLIPAANGLHYRTIWVLFEHWAKHPYALKLLAFARAFARAFCSHTRTNRDSAWSRRQVQTCSLISIYGLTEIRRFHSTDIRLAHQLGLSLQRTTDTVIRNMYKHCHTLYIDKRAIGILKIFLIKCVNCTLIRWYARSLSLSDSICFCYIVVMTGPVRPARRRFRHAVCRWSSRRGNWVILLSESWLVALRLRDRQIKWRALPLSLSRSLGNCDVLSMRWEGQWHPQVIANRCYSFVFLSVIFGLSVYSLSVTKSKCENNVFNVFMHASACMYVCVCVCVDVHVSVGWV